MLFIEKSKVTFLKISIALTILFVLAFFSFPEKPEARTQEISDGSLFKTTITHSVGKICLVVYCENMAGNNCSDPGSWFEICPH